MRSGPRYGAVSSLEEFLEGVDAHRLVSDATAHLARNVARRVVEHAQLLRRNSSAPGAGQ